MTSTSPTVDRRGTHHSEMQWKLSSSKAMSGRTLRTFQRSCISTLGTTRIMYALACLMTARIRTILPCDMNGMNSTRVCDTTQ